MSKVLIKHDPSPCGDGLPERTDIVAIAATEHVLTDHCKKKYNSEIGKKSDIWANYYTIENSNIEVVRGYFL